MNTSLPPDAFPEERRLVTVMFADIQGFTTLAEQLDFETISDLLKEIWLKVDLVIESHGGYIDKHMGDGVLAIWGAPSAGENDAESAVTAALALQETIQEYTQHAREKTVHGLKMRVGIHSGQVFAGYIGSHNEYTILGDTVNIASRLEQFAEAGTVIVSESTYTLTRGKFVTQLRPEPVLLKGKHEPVITYLIQAAQNTPDQGHYHGSQSMETHMVGRQEELNMLTSLFNQSRKSQSPTLIIISGEPGIGKSRLLMEFTTQLGQQDRSVLILPARALVQASQVPFYLWKILWHNRLNLRDDDTPKNNNERFLAEIQKLWGKTLGPASAIEAGHVIGHLIGMDWPESTYLAALKTPQARIERAFELTRVLLRRICTAYTTILLIDDLQWADKNSLELLASLMQPNQDALPLFVLAGSRPQFLQQNPEWENFSQTINLGPLPISAELVLEAYPALTNYPVTILSALANQSEGNPYFMEEMVQNLLSSNAGIETAYERIRSHPPETLQAALQARLDTLPRETRSIALLAALVGRVFWVGAVIAAMRMAAKFGTGSLSNVKYAETERLVQDALKQLEKAELVFPKAGYSFSQEQEFIFKSSLLRDIAYNLILMRYRPFYHKAVADWLANHSDVDFKLMAAEHYELAGWQAHAAHQYEQAARHAQMRGAIKEAEIMFARAALLREQAKSQKTIPVGNI